MVDARDLKSLEDYLVWVRVPPRAQIYTTQKRVNKYDSLLYLFITLIPILILEEALKVDQILTPLRNPQFAIH